MKFKKSDWTRLKEGENEGLVASMTNIIERNRTDLNKELSSYFITNVPKYNGVFDEEEGEDVLDYINDYLKENNIDIHKLSFPVSSGSDIYLIPIGDNLEIKVLVVDEYHGDGEYEKYVMIDYFLINENTTTKDVDLLINFFANV